MSKPGLLQKVAVPFFIFLLLVPSLFLLKPRPALAIGGALDTVIIAADKSIEWLWDEIQQVAQKVGTFMTANSTAITAFNTTTANFRENVLNPLAWFAAKAVIRGITRSIVTWIRSGFQGGPGFVTDPAAFIAGVVDEAIGEYVNGTKLGFLCSPFQLNIRIALAINFKRGQDPMICRLSDIGNNLNNFFSGVQGSFMQNGGLQSWFQVVSSDNPYNRYLEATTQVDIAITNARGQQIKLLDWGRGFLSWKECDTVTESVKAGQVSVDRAQEATTPKSEGGRATCTIKTPGSFIEGQLGITASSPLRQLELADSINEIVGELALQLVSQALGGIGGLLGGGSNNFTSSGFTIPSDMILPPGTTFSTNSDPRIAQEENYKFALQASLDRLRQSEQKLALAPACAAASVAGAIATQITPLKTGAEKGITEANSTIAYLQDLNRRLNVASSTDTATTAAQEFANPPSGIIFHNTSQIIEAQTRKEALNMELTQLEQQIASEGASCLAAEEAARARSAASAGSQFGSSSFFGPQGGSGSGSAGDAGAADASASAGAAAAAAADAGAAAASAEGIGI